MEQWGAARVRQAARTETAARARDSALPSRCGRRRTQLPVPPLDLTNMKQPTTSDDLLGIALLHQLPLFTALTTGRADAPRRHYEPTHRPMHSNHTNLARAPSSNYTNSTPRLTATPRPIAQTPRPVQTPRLLSECPIGGTPRARRFCAAEEEDEATKKPPQRREIAKPPLRGEARAGLEARANIGLIPARPPTRGTGQGAGNRGASRPGTREPLRKHNRDVLGSTQSIKHINNSGRYTARPGTRGHQQHATSSSVVPTASLWPEFNSVPELSICN